jgi:hypothetical protein
LTEKDSFKRAGVLIVGVSGDTVEKQKAFVEKAKLTVSLPRKLRHIGQELHLPNSTPFLPMKTPKQEKPMA